MGGSDHPEGTEQRNSLEQHRRRGGDLRRGAFCRGGQSRAHPARGADELLRPAGGKIREVASRAIANPKLQLEQDLSNLKDILEGEATPEEIQRRPAASTLQSGVVAFLTSGGGLLVLGTGILLLLILRRRRRSGGRSGGVRGKSCIILEF